MINSTKASFSQILLLLMCFTLFCFMPGCGGSGGGGGSSSGDIDGDGVVDTNNSTLTLEITSNTITFGTPVTITATLTDAAGEPAPNTVVTFAAADEIVAFTPAAGTGLTNANGVTTITLNSASIDSEGATSITASASVTFQDATVTTTSEPLGVTVGGAEVTLGTVTVGTSPISAYGTSSVRVPVLIGGTAATVPISVTFTSPCVSSGKATLSSPVTSAAGVATSTYTDNGCASGTTAITDTIRASSGDASSNGTITINPTTVNNIAFVSATPEIIATQTVGSATLPKSSLVKFQVLDNNSKGKPGVLVDFTLIADTLVGGLSRSPISATSDNDGYVTTSVTSGTVPTPVWVVATVHGSSPVISCQSNKLSITTGLPAQNSFSLSVGTYNIEGLQYDRTETSLNINAADRLGNPVPEGTAINFITPESSVIDPASCTTNASGACSVTFRSLGNRPTDGRATVLAYAVGEKSFTDADGDNSYDSGEAFYDLGDLYVDFNENGVWDTGEQYYAPYGTAGSSACLIRPSGSALPASYADVLSKENTCNSTWGINYVRRSRTIVLSGSHAYVSQDTFPTAGSCFATYDFMLTDVNNNPMPAGTTVAINSSLSNVNYTYTALEGNPPTTVTKASPATLDIAGTPVRNTSVIGGTMVSIIINGGTGCAEKIAQGSLIDYPIGPVAINVTTPKGNITTIGININ